MIVSSLAEAARGALHPVAQPEEGVTYAHKIDKGEAAIDWALPADVIERRVRAFDPFPGASFDRAGETIKLWRVQVERPDAVAAPGTVIAADAHRVVVACGDGALSLLDVQRPGGKRQPVASWLQAHRLVAGDVLGVDPGVGASRARKAACRPDSSGHRGLKPRPPLPIRTHHPEIIMLRRPLILVGLLVSLTGCDQLGLESASVTAARIEANGKAVGAACRHGGRAIEDCFTLNRRVDKAAIYAGWREMDDYMRENKMEAVAPTLGADGKGRATADASDVPDAPASKSARATSPRTSRPTSRRRRTRSPSWTRRPTRSPRRMPPRQRTPTRPSRSTDPATRGRRAADARAKQRFAPCEARAARHRIAVERRALAA